MRIRADFDLPAVVRPSEACFVPSPMPGVERILLDRIGEELARATSIVRYAPGSRFSAHVHRGGEEYLVLEGIFSDESGDHPPGTYVRNPVGSRHAPYSDAGCTIFVKLQQFSPEDRRQSVCDTRGTDFEATAHPGIERLSLHSFGAESTELIRLAPGAAAPRHRHVGGEECLVLEGELEDDDGRYPTGTWLRLPVGSSHAPRTTTGCLLWRKTGHLAAIGSPTEEAVPRV